MRSLIPVALRIPLYQSFRALGFPRVLPVNFTFSLTTRCNSRCLTCNIWKKRTNEFTPEEWQKVCQSLGNAPYWITISGGEPFLYRHLLAVCEAIGKYCRPGIVNIPTNSLIQGTASKVEKIAALVAPAQLIINLSLDGIGAEHDRIRGIPGNFARFQRNLNELLEVRQRAPNLSLGIHSVVSTYNIDRIEELAAYARSLPVDQFITEMAEERVELDTVGLPIAPDADKYFAVLDRLSADLERSQARGIARFTRAFRLSYYGLMKRTLEERTQVIPCFAGWASAQIYPDGTVWPCCIRADSIANLRDVGYDFKKIWFGKEIEAVRRSIREKECWCTLANAAYTNMLVHPPTLAQTGWRMLRPTRPERSKKE
ncbi:MAG TPA: radical SAM protein [Anaerolineaceae bacterium]